MLQSLGSVQAGTNGYALGFQKSASDPDLFINGFSVKEGSNWNSALKVNTPTTGFTYLAGGVHTYSLGQAISGDASWSFRAAWFDVEAPTSVAAGVYDFILEVRGGASSESEDVLAQLSLQIAIFDRLEYSLEAELPSSVSPGGTFDLGMTMTNLNRDRSIRINNLFFDSFSGPSNSQLEWLDAYPNWLGKTIGAGNALSNLHSTWRAPSDALPGAYVGYNGLVGGFFSGDTLFFAPNHSIQAVPEPLTMTLGIAAAALGVKRVRRNRRLR